MVGARGDGCAKVFACLLDGCRRIHILSTSLLQDVYLCALSNVFPPSQYTPLHYAAREGHLDMCRLLLQCSADMEAKNE
jgi:hypothetical protein